MSDRVQVDYAELEGFQYGKAAALAEWQHRKEKREFKRLCKRLEGQKRWREIVAEGGERLKRRRASRNRHQATREYMDRLNAKRRARRAAARAKDIKPCPVCGVRFKRKGHGAPATYCSRACKDGRHQGRPAATRAKPSCCSACGEAGHNRRTCGFPDRSKEQG